MNEGRHVPGIGDQEGVRALGHEHQAGSQGVDVVQRQRAHQHLFSINQVASEPFADLLQIGHHVAVGQYCALGHTGDAPGVLQKRHVAMRQGHMLQDVSAALAQGCIELDGSDNFPVRHQFFDVLHHHIGDHFFEEGKQITDLGRDDGGPQPGLAVQYLLQGVGKILQHHNGRSA